MIVVLDTNAIFNDWELRKPSFQLLCKYATLSQDLHIMVPDVVFQEAVALYRKGVYKHFLAAAKAVSSLSGLLPSSHDLPVFQPADEASNAATIEYAKRLRARIDEIGRMPTHEDIPQQGLLSRCLSRRRPFNESGGGYGDALIWEVILRKVVAKDEVTFLVTTNHKDFAKDNGYELHRDLIRDLEDRGLPTDSVQLIDSVDSLVTEHVKPHLHSTDAVPGLKDGSHENFHLVEWFKENREEIGEQIDPEPFLRDLSPIQLDEPTVCYIEDPESVDVVEVYELDNERVFIDVNARAEARFQFFVDKRDYYLHDEVPIEIEDSNWNESVMLAEVSLYVPIGLAIAYNARNQEVEVFEVIIPEIFGVCANCCTPVLHDAAESCSECGHSFFRVRRWPHSNQWTN